MLHRDLCCLCPRDDLHAVLVEQHLLSCPRWALVPVSHSVVLYCSLVWLRGGNPSFCPFKTRGWESSSSLAQPPRSGNRHSVSQPLGSWSKALAKFLMSKNSTNCCCKHLGRHPSRLESSAEGGKKGKIFPFLSSSCCLQNVRVLTGVLTLATSQPQRLHSCWQKATGLTSFQNIFFFSSPHDFLCLPRRKRFVGNLWRYNSVTFQLRSGHASHLLHLKLLYSKIHEVLYRL